MKRKVSKISRPIRPFGEAGGWKDVEKPLDVFRALGHPIRKRIFELLDESPLQQSELQRILERESGKRIDPAGLLHHLKHLEDAGLILKREIREGKIRKKLVYRAADLRVQLYRRPEAEVEE